MTFSSLKQGISTLTKGPVVGSTMGGGGGLVKRCHRARVLRKVSRARPSAMAAISRLAMHTSTPCTKPKPMRSRVSSTTSRWVGGMAWSGARPASWDTVTSL